jgi:membrane protein required for colicin V production
MSVAGFNWVDWSVMGLIALSTLVGVMRGFIKEAFSLVIWVLAFWVAFKFSNGMADAFLAKHITQGSIRYGIAFAGLFVATLIVGGLLNHIFGTFVKRTGLGGTDRILGIVFGFLRGVMIIAVVLLFAELTPATKQKWYQESHLVPHFIWVSQWIHDALPQKLQAQLQPYATSADASNNPALNAISKHLPQSGVKDLLNSTENNTSSNNTAANSTVSVQTPDTNSAAVIDTNSISENNNTADQNKLENQ